MADYYGVYRAVVINAADPERLGRVTVSCPDVLGVNTTSGWAAVVGTERTPPRYTAGDAVWVTFEQGDADFPVVLGRVYEDPSSTD